LSFNLAQNIRHYGFKRLLLAVSGGLDSICLAHYFIENKEVLGIEWLGIAHVHHGLREGTADRDAAFVETFAKSHNVPFSWKSWMAKRSRQWMVRSKKTRGMQGTRHSRNSS
jgi:Predicted ATPase of the PP-loop superfamily implicated in cell cycle control